MSRLVNWLVPQMLDMKPLNHGRLWLLQDTYKTGSKSTEDLDQDWGMVQHNTKESRKILKVGQGDYKAENKFG